MSLTDGASFAQIVETLVVLGSIYFILKQLKLQRQATQDQAHATQDQARINLIQTVAIITSWVQAEDVRDSRGLLFKLEDTLTV